MHLSFGPSCVQWLIAFLMLIEVGLWAAPPGGQDRPHPPVTDELLIKFKGGARGLSADRAQRSFRHQVKRHFDHVGWQHIRLPAGANREQMLARYRNDPDVVAVEPNYVFHLRVNETASVEATPPNDPRVNEQWGLDKIGITNAWATLTGNSNVVVAILDTGVSYTHQDLAPNMWRNPGEIPGNGIDDDGNGYVDDVHGIDAVNQDSDPLDQPIGFTFHGTACASIIGAAGNNGNGVAGVTWPVRLMALRLAATSNYIASAWVVECFEYVLAMKSRGINIRVTSNSYGIDDSPSLAVRDAINAVGHAGVVNVFAAGNNSRNVDVLCDYPTCFHLPSVINVAASDIFDNLASFSNYGATNVDLAAPGVNILVADGFETNSFSPGFSGTSAACPHVAGGAALLAAAYPAASVGQIKSALLGSVDLLPAFTNKVATHGRLNIGRALQQPHLATNAPPVIHAGPESLTVGLGYSATFRVKATGMQPTHYYWRFADNPLSTTVDPVLTLPAVSLQDEGLYSVSLSNTFGMSTSAVAVLTVATTPVILAQSSSLRVLDRSNITLRVTAAGAAPLRFRWQYNSQDMAAETNTSLSLTNLSGPQSGDYRLIMGNSYGQETSAVMRLTVFTRPYIVASPQSQTVAVGTDVALSVTVTNTASLPIGARWLFNGTSAGTNFLSNTFTAVLNLTNVQTTSAGRWSALVTNEGPIAASAFMSALANLTVVVSPTNQTVLAGANVTLSSLAAGPATIRYQWQHAGTNLPNATNPNLTLSGVREADAGLYTVVITNANGQATGFSATLNVIVPQLTLGQPRHVAPGRFEMVVTGLISQQQYAIDVSTNLVAWSALTTFTATNSTVPLADETAGSASQRFYRARSMP